MQKPLTLVSVRRVHSRAMLELSNGETRVMPRAMLRERPYRGGTPFDPASFEAFLRERAYPFAMEKAVALLAMRSRTERELREALRLAAYPEAVIDRVMERLGEAGYTDDADFAKGWATSRAAKGMGERRIRMELRQKGVPQETIEETLTDLDEDDLFDGAMKAARKAARGKDLASPSDRQKISAALLRRGYSYATARRALQMLAEEEEEE